MNAQNENYQEDFKSQITNRDNLQASAAHIRNIYREETPLPQTQNASECIRSDKPSPIPNTASTESGKRHTRSGREIKTPQKYQDFECNIEGFV